jgi:hypothetical protein
MEIKKIVKANSELNNKMLEEFKQFKNPTFNLISFDLYSCWGEMEITENDCERNESLEQWDFTIEYKGKHYETKVELNASTDGGSFSVGLKLENQWIYEKEKLGKDLDELCDDIYSFFHCRDLESVICIYSFINK